ncbi:YfhO family protein [Candidatus Poribacteria bacterium]|nr:YfhO family protein [Candidatus Poribacteria bacterium]
MKITRDAFTHRKKGEWSALVFNARFLSIAIIIAFAFIFWWARVEHTDAKQQLPAGSNMDMYAYHLPAHEYGFTQLKAGRMPLWNPYTNCGMPFLATYQPTALFYPLGFFHWFLRVELAFSLTYLLHFVVAGLFMYLWMRELGCAHAAAALAGTAYMLCSFVCYPLTWPQNVLSHAWIPIIFYFIHRTFFHSRWTDSVLLGASVACQFLAGYADGFVYTVRGAIAYLIFLSLVRVLAHEREPRLLGRSFALVAVGLIAIPAMLAAIQWIPTFQLSRLSARPPGGLTLEAVLSGGSLYPSTFFAALINPGSFKWSQYALYPGLVTLIMAAFAFVQRKRWRDLVFFSALAVISTLIAFGAHTPLFNLYFSLPMGAWFRLPNRQLILTAFSIATLAGIGCNHLVEDVLAKPKPFKNAAARYGILLAICVAFLLLIPKAGAVFVAILLVGCLLGASGRSANIVGFLAILLVALDLILYISDPVTYPWITRNVFPDLKEEREFLQKNVGLDRVHVFHRKRDWKNYLVNANFGLVERIRETSGYETLSLQRFAEFCAYLDTGGEPSRELPFTGALHWTSESVNPRMLNVLGARYIIDDPGRDLYPEKVPLQRIPKGFNLRRVFSGKLTIYENPDALPRALYVKNVEVIQGKHAAIKRLADPSFNYRKTAILEEEPEPPATAPEPSAVPDKLSSPELIVKPRTEGETDIIVDVPEPGFVLVNDTYVPGWHAKVDGNRSKIYRADYLFMAIPVGAGKHAIELEYRPLGFRMGRWISILSVVAFSLSLAFDVARRRAREMSPWETEPGKTAQPRGKERRKYARLLPRAPGARQKP